jgi:hypothetical protein
MTALSGLPGFDCRSAYRLMDTQGDGTFVYWRHPGVGFGALCHDEGSSPLDTAGVTSPASHERSPIRSRAVVAPFDHFLDRMGDVLLLFLLMIHLPVVFAFPILERLADNAGNGASARSVVLAPIARVFWLGLSLGVLMIGLSWPFIAFAWLGLPRIVLGVCALWAAYTWPFLRPTERAASCVSSGRRRPNLRRHIKIYSAASSNSGKPVASIAARSFGGVIGKSGMRSPAAPRIALAIAAIGGTIGTSPTPRAPNG